MKQAHELAESFEDALGELRLVVDDGRRQLAAYALTQYPDAAELESLAHEVLDKLGSRAVEINAIFGDRQVTIMFAPERRSAARPTVPETSSLCVLTVGVNKPLAVNDIKNDPITASHPGRKLWGAWASAPVQVDDVAAGTVCALESTKRDWSDEDQRVLESVAQTLGHKVHQWMEGYRWTTSPSPGPRSA